MSTTVWVTVALVALAATAGLAPSAGARELPPVCGDIYNWCQGVIDDARAEARDIVCSLDPPACPL